MATLTRRRDPDARQESWRVFYGDIVVGTIGVRSGVPVHVDQWTWSCGFYPVSHRGERENGTAADFDQARADFEAAWRRLRIHIEKINGPMLFQLKVTPAEYKAGLDRAIANGWPVLHESGPQAWKSCSWAWGFPVF
jgi:hypothetical protein